MHTLGIDDDRANWNENKEINVSWPELINYLLFHRDNMADKIKNT